jgi:hypothetical protein
MKQIQLSDKGLTGAMYYCWIWVIMHPYGYLADEPGIEDHQLILHNLIRVIVHETT